MKTVHILLFFILIFPVLLPSLLLNKIKIKRNQKEKYILLNTSKDSDSENRAPALESSRARLRSCLTTSALPGLMFQCSNFLTGKEFRPCERAVELEMLQSEVSHTVPCVQQVLCNHRLLLSLLLLVFAINHRFIWQKGTYAMLYQYQKHTLPGCWKIIYSHPMTLGLGIQLDEYSF